MSSKLMRWMIARNRVRTKPKYRRVFSGVQIKELDSYVKQVYNPPLEHVSEKKHVSRPVDVNFYMHKVRNPALGKNRTKART
ncbi:hypothetical protein GOV04_04355 [Candidatus Woesearchaeota archaeon]|nr:hypothetical protein [Candidatus Woesearchaeota archaeon]